ncbi:TetR/AcrR family transcriptional regulator [Haloechinothrix halophila]|uniref:TetR/AcrR family transcriptional regulator n=1 Tax=Haloechinothrix halophila TaxID=1069073 RepID=UPI0004256ABC|nr:TetR family transcriptional regulator [Haloechinothrix halophila]
MTAEQRTWAGTTLADRKATRRGQLIEAGLELLGTTGTPAVSVRAVCRTAKLTERYFYESFADRDALLLAVYDQVAQEAHDALVAAVRDARDELTALVRAAVTSFVELIIDDPRKGTVLLLAPLTDPALVQRGAELLPNFTALIHDQLPASIDDTERRLIAVGVTGALTNLFTAYLNGSLDVPRDRLVEHCVRMLLAAAHGAR